MKTVLDNDIKGKLLEFAKDSYENEINIKNTISSRLPSVATVITLLFGALSYFLKSIKIIEFNVIWICFVFCLGGLFFCIAFSLYYLYKCLFTYEYSYVARPTKIHKYLMSIDQYNEDARKYNHAAGSNEKKTRIDLNNELLQTLIEHYSKSAHINRDNNIRKNVFFTKTLSSVFIGIVLLILSASFYYGNQIYCQLCKQEKEITNLKETKQMLQENENQQFIAGDDDPKEEPTPPVRPETEMIIENEMPASEIETRVPKDTTEKDK